MENKEMVNVRSELLERLQLELIGPNDPFETLIERPSQRYLCGILWPVRTQIDKSEDDNLDSGNEGEETGNEENLAPLLQAMNPSAIGLSFIVEGEHTVEANISWGKYKEVPDVGGNTEKTNWSRINKSQDNITIDVTKTDVRQSIPLQNEEHVFVEYQSRSLTHNKYAVSLFLVNRKLKPKKVVEDLYCIFQPVITISGISQGSKPFAVRKIDDDISIYKSMDDQSDDLLYRDQQVFANGHGVAVEWADLTKDGKHAGKLTTITMPFYEIPRVIPPKWENEGSLDMKKLANANDGDEIYSYLSPLCREYTNWIHQEERKLKDLDPTFHETGKRHIGNCKKAVARMEEGLQLIKSEKDVFIAFRFANKAMSLQIEHSVWAKKKEKDFSKGPDKIDTQWRPFQIAFVLQGLAGLSNPEHDDRNITDLLWFPTGGGKTEAYLGLAAFTMALRRMKKDQGGYRGDAGVTVLMRYTLRLLTIQQFQRATALICACETLRKNQPELFGHVPFRIGLWVGIKSTPNTFDEALDAVKQTKESYKKKSVTFNKTGTPVQVLTCPWCGASLVNDEKSFSHSYFPDRRKRRVHIYCSRKECEFGRSPNSDGIPVLVTDEEIYRLLPDLLIGTVDKFARMPWVGEIQGLFGKIAGEVKGWGFIAPGADEDTVNNMKKVTNGIEYSDTRKLLPPELIIQDELHLISGPLGTMVGLYETAVDTLSSRIINGKSVGPKVVASTATIRQAKEQVKGLFARDISIFPSPGLSSNDSFFAVEQPLESVPGRVYAGIFAPGKSMKTALVRIYSALLASTGAMEEFSKEDLDPYQTVVGYYNSLRELGGAVRLVEDDVRARMDVLEKRQEGQNYKFLKRNYENDVPELTSRIDSKDIPKILDDLNQPFYGKMINKPVDIVLASNMISVGVDVDRLGLMVVTGQPKTTAEYIQSTSRVGRKFPGLVITLYNWARPRDVSHYEQFLAYHSALYRYVEAISVTPFASRARDRGLAATFISMVRLEIEEMAKKQDAGNFEEDNNFVQLIKSRVLERVEKIDNSDRRNEVLKDLEGYFEVWETDIKIGSLYYNGGGKKARNLMYSLGNKKSGSFGVPNSMRDVETTLGIYLRKEE
ncbi:DISARM system helicase DrmA [Fredinandcohnia onubensis]|uniref:DISARM system helicase DrmA n=1 Tax=Fredinandcohnia onubensis TaxID=1571209 RepID=UPI00211F147F|nr:DISARM system helicase DrmA [Fredinandcohnia onubensis]